MGFNATNDARLGDIESSVFAAAWIECLRDALPSTWSDFADAAAELAALKDAEKAVDALRVAVQSRTDELV